MSAFVKTCRIVQDISFIVNELHTLTQMREGKEERSKVIFHFLHTLGDVTLSLAFSFEQGQRDLSGACQWASCPVTTMSLAFLLLSLVALMHWHREALSGLPYGLCRCQDRGPGLSVAD